MPHRGNLAVWFALHTVFGTVAEETSHGVRLFVPTWETVDPAAVLIAVLAFAALFRFDWGMIRTLVVSAVADMLYHLVVSPTMGT